MAASKDGLTRKQRKQQRNKKQRDLRVRTGAVKPQQQHNTSSPHTPRPTRS